MTTTPRTLLATGPDPLRLPESTDTTISAFLDAIAAGRGEDLGALYAPDAHADLTVPNWRFSADGRESIAAEYGRWFSAPGTFEELEVLPTPTGVVVTYVLTWVESGVPHAAHHSHVLTMRDGLIVRDTVFCGGRWSAALLAEMEEAARGR